MEVAWPHIVRACLLKKFAADRAWVPLHSTPTTTDSTLMTQQAGNGIDSPGVQLVAERAAASFPVRELTYFLDGGPEKTRMRERFEAIIEAEPVFRRSCADYSLSRPERYRLAMRKQLRLCELVKELQLTGNYATAGSDVRALRLALSLALSLRLSLRSSLRLSQPKPA